MDMSRRHLTGSGLLALASLTASAGARGESACASDTAANAALLDRYLAALNARDTSSFPQLFTATYLQHSGRSPSGLAAQVENFQRIFASMPDLQVVGEDRV